MRVRKLVLVAVLCCMAIGTSAVAFRAPGSLDQIHASRPLLEGAQIDAKSFGMVERACQNCHSDQTRWPWYSRVPLASWLISRDVMRARERFNLSRWNEYSSAEKQAILSAIGTAVRSIAMPPGRYTMLHPDGRLSPQDREHLYQWTRRERFRNRFEDFPTPTDKDNPQPVDSRFIWDRRF